MITISEKPTKKMPGFTSLFISFDYNTAIIEALKTVPNMMYHKSLKAWETPLSLLSEVIDKLCSIDDITINWLPDKPEKTVKDIKLSKYKTKPMSHQIEAIKYGLVHDKWLLLDEPGLGKSLDIIYLAQELKKRENIQHCLVICGVNTIKTNWRREIEKHSDLPVRILGERTTKTGNRVIGSVADRLEQLKHPIDEFFVVTNIETLRSIDIINAINNESVNRFDMIVVDEVHACLDYDSLINTNIGELKIFTSSPSFFAFFTISSRFSFLYPGSITMYSTSKRNFEYLCKCLKHNAISILSLPPEIHTATLSFSFSISYLFIALINFRQMSLPNLFVRLCSISFSQSKTFSILTTPTIPILLPAQFLDHQC